MIENFVCFFLNKSHSISGLSHPGPLLHPGGPHPPSPLASMEAMHNMSRDRELMAFMLANSGRFDPMTLAALAANPLQVCFSRVSY